MSKSRSKAKTKPGRWLKFSSMARYFTRTPHQTHRLRQVTDQEPGLAPFRGSLSHSRRPVARIFRPLRCVLDAALPQSDPCSDTKEDIALRGFSGWAPDRGGFDERPAVLMQASRMDGRDAGQVCRACSSAERLHRDRQQQRPGELGAPRCSPQRQPGDGDGPTAPRILGSSRISTKQMPRGKKFTIEDMNAHPAGRLLAACRAWYAALQGLDGQIDAEKAAAIAGWDLISAGYGARRDPCPLDDDGGRRRSEQRSWGPGHRQQARWCSRACRRWTRQPRIGPRPVAMAIWPHPARPDHSVCSSINTVCNLFERPGEITTSMPPARFRRIIDLADVDKTMAADSPGRAGRWCITTISGRSSPTGFLLQPCPVHPRGGRR